MTKKKTRKTAAKLKNAIQEVLPLMPTSEAVGEEEINRIMQRFHAGQEGDSRESFMTWWSEATLGSEASEAVAKRKNASKVEQPREHPKEERHAS